MDPSDVPLWLTKQEASQLLRDEFNVSLTPKTIENKIYRGEMPWEFVAGVRRINRDALREWARPTPMPEEAR